MRVRREARADKENGSGGVLAKQQVQRDESGSPKGAEAQAAAKDHAWRIPPPYAADVREGDREKRPGCSGRADRGAVTILGTQTEGDGGGSSLGERGCAWTRSDGA